MMVTKLSSCPRCGGKLLLQELDDYDLNCISCGNIIYQRKPMPYEPRRGNGIDTRRGRKKKAFQP